MGHKARPLRTRPFRHSPDHGPIPWSDRGQTYVHEISSLFYKNILDQDFQEGCIDTVRPFFQNGY